MDIQLSSDLSRCSLSHRDIVNSVKLLNILGFELGEVSSDEDVNELDRVILDLEYGQDSDACMVLAHEDGVWNVYYSGHRVDLDGDREVYKGRKVLSSCEMIENGERCLAWVY